MALKPKLVPGWPKLAWLATFAEGDRCVEVYHGPCVETHEQWCVEAVWAGEYAAGDFDRTDVVFGSGVRVRDDCVIFVTAGTAMDRLWYCRRGQQWFVSNSLGALSALADLSLVDGDCYANDRQSTIRTTWGDPLCTRPFPTHSGEAHLVWFNNLAYDGRSLKIVQKPDSAAPFKSFADYRGFLVQGAEGLRRNLESPARRHKVMALASVSSGYDSSATAIIAKHAGCRQAVTIKQASSFWRRSDSGQAIADHLGLACRICERTAEWFPHEEAFWAASGYCNLINWTLFEYPQPLCLFFTGNYGDVIWTRSKLPDPFTIEIWDDLAMGEFRLLAGMWQCIVPFWGMRHHKEIEAITFSQEMEPWTLHNDYDRPIARRIVEEAGVPRGSFATRKQNTSHEAEFRWPYSPYAHERFSCYLKGRGFRAPGRRLVRLLRVVAHLENLLQMNLLGRLGLRKRLRPWQRLAGTRLLVQWANEELRQMYDKALAEARGRETIRP